MSKEENNFVGWAGSPGGSGMEGKIDQEPSGRSCVMCDEASSAR